MTYKVDAIHRRQLTDDQLDTRTIEFNFKRSRKCLKTVLFQETRERDTDVFWKSTCSKLFLH